MAVRDLDGRRFEFLSSWSAELATLTPDESRELEREYVAHRAAVLAMLRADYRSLPDHEELYQEAWTELLELRARGEEIENVNDADPHPPDARATATLLRVDRDAV